MAFTKALYYPWIDIRDEIWLKTAALFWEKIQTIVPGSIECPYSTCTGQTLMEEEILTPFFVNSDMPEIRSIESDVIRYINSQEGAEIITGIDSEQRLGIHSDKIYRLLRDEVIGLHHSKTSRNIHLLLRDLKHRIDRDGFIDVDSRFASFYMTLLATRLSEQLEASLVTSANLPYQLSLKAKPDAQIIGLNDYHRIRYYCDSSNDFPFSPRVEEGIMTQVLINSISIDPETPIEKIVKYRHKYTNELQRFRRAISDLSLQNPGILDIEGLRSYYENWYINKVEPSIQDMKDSLKGMKIMWYTSSLMSLALFSVSSESMIGLTGLNLPCALLTGAAISVIGSKIKYNVEKENALRRNPYSYLMLLNKFQS